MKGDRPSLASAQFDFETEYNKCLDNSGGFGLFQIFICAIVLLGANATTFMYNSLSYLELAPDYQCKIDNIWQSCETDSICSGDNVEWRIDHDCATCLYNWVGKLDLTCAPKWKTGLIGSSLWIGWVVSLLFLPRLADVYGRRWVYAVGMWLLLPVMVATLLNHSLDVMIVCIFCQGFLSTVRVSIGFVYMMEFVAKKH